MKKPPRLRVMWLGLVPLAAVAAFLLAGTSNALPKEIPLHGSMKGINHRVPPSRCASPIPPSQGGPVCSQFDASGAINGHGIVTIDTFPDPTKFGYSEAHTVITTNKGELHCHEAALFDLVGGDHPFVDLCLIDGGTGIYAGASGYIQEAGTFDFVHDLGQLDYSGKLVFGS
jgi:hypothetical protein